MPDPLKLDYATARRSGMRPLTFRLLIYLAVALALLLVVLIIA